MSRALPPRPLSPPSPDWPRAPPRPPGRLRKSGTESPLGPGVRCTLERLFRRCFFLVLAPVACRRPPRPALAERRRRLLLPKPCSGVYFGGAFSRFSPPGLAGAPPRPAPAERRRRFPLPKPASGVYFGGAFSWFVLPWLTGAPPPAPPDHHCAGFLRTGAPEPACRTQTGRPGSRMCRDFAVRRGKSGMPPAKRTTWPPSGPIKHSRIGARDCDSSIASAFSRPGTSNPRECCRFRKLHLRICRKSPPRPRAGASNPRECCEFEKRHLRICRKLPSRPPSGASIPR